MNILSFPESEQRPRASDIEGTKLLIGEGSHEAHFFNALLSNMGIENIQLGNYAGKDKLSLFLRALRKLPGFKHLAHLGITRDADDSHAGAFASVCSALKNEKFVCPKRVGEFSSGTVQSGVFIMPDNTGPGMMETLCLRTVESDPSLKCVDAFLDCVKKKAQRRPNSNKVEKARAHAYLASMPIPDKNPGLAARGGYWNLDSSVLDPLKLLVETLSGL